METPEIFGERITPDAANKYFEAYDEVQRGMEKFTAPSSSPNDLQVQSALNYANTKVNAFVFKRIIVEELMSLWDKHGNLPEYLMIHFAAHPEGNDKGKPTLVILGCNKKIEKNEEGKPITKYISMKNGKPGAETPGKSFEALFPPELVKETIEFIEM